VPTGYGYVLPDQNGWSRYLHFQAAWVVVLTGLLSVIFGLFYWAFEEKLASGRPDLSWRAFSTAIASHLRLERPVRQKPTRITWSSSSPASGRFVQASGASLSRMVFPRVSRI
jgi:hypothetical protein